MLNLSNWHNETISKIEIMLDNLLDTYSASDTLLASIKYSTLAGGKRIRPLFSVASAMLNNDSSDTPLIVGCAIEMIHCFSLIHDDLPIMDNDNLRRGKPTNHIVYGDAIALLAGDALHSLCFEILSSDKLILSAQTKLDIIYNTAKAIGLNGMVGGQVIDWLNTGKNITLEELKTMHMLKTGALLKSSIINGYIASNNSTADNLAKITLIADKIGLLFQIVDDIIDVTESTHTLGKTANKDAEQNKATYVNILGLEHSKLLANQLHDEAINLLKEFQNSEYLQYLTDIVYFRNN